MAVDQGVLKGLIETMVDSEMAGISIPGVSYSGPLSQPDPSYFVEMCNAISTGIASGVSITVDTDDDGVKGDPVIAGAGAGVGIKVNAAFFEEQIYTLFRNYAIADFGSTEHPIYALAGPTNFLKAMAKGISEAIELHFKVSWAYVTVHPDIYSGTSEIPKGGFSGLSASTIKSAMIAAGPSMAGPGWARKCEAISNAYVDTIHNESENLTPLTISGVCVVTPTPPQACGIPATGNGTGTAA